MIKLHFLAILNIPLMFHISGSPDRNWPISSQGVIIWQEVAYQKRVDLSIKNTDLFSVRQPLLELRPRSEEFLWGNLMKFLSRVATKLTWKIHNHRSRYLSSHAPLASIKHVYCFVNYLSFILTCQSACTLEARPGDVDRLNRTRGLRFKAST